VVATSAGSSQAAFEMPMPSQVRAPQTARKAKAQTEDDPDLDSFLAGGRAMAGLAAKAQRAAKEREAMASANEEQKMQEEAAAVAARERLEAERKEREKERRRREEEEREEERKREERRKIRQEEKRRRKEEKARLREAARREAGVEEEDEPEDDDSSDERESRRVAAPAKVAGVFKQVFKGDESKRQHWGESVKGRVSNDYKGTSDAELERRFGLTQQHSNPGEKLMTEEEVLAMLRKGKM